LSVCVWKDIQKLYIRKKIGLEIQTEETNMDDTMINNVAKTVNVAADTLRSKAESVLAEQGAAWKNAGKSDDDCGILALRVAARMISTENARLSRSGATKYEGMFISVPRPKEWGKILYNKMSGQLRAATEDVRNVLVESGAVVLFENNHDGTYTRHAREDFYGVETADVSELPRHTQKLDENTHFFVVWDKNNKTFPSGDANFKYGRPRPQDERERTMLFLGRKQGTTDEVKTLTVKATQKGADVQYPTFTTGTIALRPAANGTTAYAKDGVSVFESDAAVAGIFSADPLTLVPQIIGQENMISGLDKLGQYYDTHNGNDGWWDRTLATVAEVIHIDPRDNGGYVLVCADLDIASTAATVDVYIPSEQDSLVDFAVGTKVLLHGQAWRTKEGEDRMSISGWYAFDKIAVMDEVVSTNDGWDE